MSKKVKYLSYAIALVLVAGIMTIAIWAATSASAGISANVSWTASAGIEFELEAWVVNNEAGNGIGNTSTPKSIEKQIVTASTSNTTAQNLAGDLACGFYDGTNDGVNNPSNIVFTYKIKNTGSGILKVTATKTPNNQAESGTTAENHKPKVILNSSYEGINTTTSQTSAIYGTGYNIPASGTLTYTVTLSIDNAELNISSFDAGVTFNFSVGNQTEVYINGVSQTLIANAITIGDYVNALDGKAYPGYYYDENLTKIIPESDYDKVLLNSAVTFYTKPATLDKLTFISKGNGTCSVTGSGNVSGDIIIPSLSPAGDRVTIVEAIEGSDFLYNWNITSIILPEGLIEIADNTFGEVQSVKYLSFPESLEKIGTGCFGFMLSLKELYIPKNVFQIGAYSFGGNFSILDTIVVHKDNTAFSDGNGSNVLIETATKKLIRGASRSIIPDGIEIIGSYAFYYSSPKEVIMPNSVRIIEDNAFSESKLEYITLSNTLESIGTYAFGGCPYLHRIDLPDSLKEIGTQAFFGNLIHIYVPLAVEKIGPDAFYTANNMQIYCGASSKPNGWDSNWNRGYSSNWNSIVLSTTWGVTREQYNSLYA